MSNYFGQVEWNEAEVVLLCIVICTLEHENRKIDSVIFLGGRLRFSMSIRDLFVYFIHFLGVIRE